MKRINKISLATLLLSGMCLVPTNLANAEEINSEELAEEITDIRNDLESLITKESFSKYKESLIKKFILITDFIFFDEEIDNIKFSDLTEEVKKEVLESYIKIDELLEDSFPNYKADLDEKYQITSSEIQEKYNEVKEALDEKLEEKIGSNNYDKYKETLNETKSFVKDKSTTIYEKSKVKVKNWYNSLKEKNR